MSRPQDKPRDAAELSRLRDLINAKSDGKIDTDQLDVCLPLLEWLHPWKHGRCPVAEVPPELRDGDALRIAAQDGLVEFGRQKHGEGNERINRFGGWYWTSVTRNRRGLLASDIGGKSMPEILDKFERDNARRERCRGFDTDVLWHVRMVPSVRSALADWRLSREVGGAPVQSVTKTPMSRQEANTEAGKLLKADPSFVSKTQREWVAEIGCSKGLIGELATWKAVQELRTKAADYFDEHPEATDKEASKSVGCEKKLIPHLRGWCAKQSRKPRPPKKTRLTARLQATIPNDGDGLKRLMAEQEADYEPSPLVDDLPDTPPKPVRAPRGL